MAIRVKVLIKRGKGEVDTVAIVNAGYESDEPEALVPVRLAERLGMWPELPQGTRVEAYRSAGGIVSLYSVPKAVDIVVKTEDKNRGSSSVNIVISDKEEEVLLSDKLIDSLDIEILKPGKGIWRFADDPLGKERGSQIPEYW